MSAQQPLNGDPGRDPAAAELRIVSSGATPEEIAAVTAVLHGALQELADGLAAQAGPGVSAWQRSQRPVRGPLRPGPGAWRGFSG